MAEFLQLGQHVTTTAATCFHRFFMRQPLQVSRSGPGWSHYEVAAACVFLACKVEESLRKLPAIVDAAMASLDKSHEGQLRWADRSFRSNHASHEFVKWRDVIILHEEAVLTTLCFDLVMPQPHEVLVRATRLLGVEQPLARLAWTVLNDTLRDPTCVLFDAPVLAAGAFLKACRERGVDPAQYYAARPPDAPPVSAEDDYFDWLDVFDVDEEEALASLDAIQQDVYDFHAPLQQQRPKAKGPGRSARAAGERRPAEEMPVAADKAPAPPTQPPSSAPPSPLRSRVNSASPRDLGEDMG
ncbi:hypothetical protein MSPP1_003399 [Malassezia sp. CBS 17886]|nr:hypothetical protein MSPP1_003399 [Malassezia sp. CBS 17886]